MGIDYHVSFEKNHYSVPYGLIGQKVEVHASRRMIEVVHKSEVVARHLRQLGQGEFTTVREHMPSNHRVLGEWNDKRFLRWAESIGAKTQRVITEALASREHPEQAFRRCIGILNLARKYGPERLEAACGRGQLFGHCSYRSIKEILANEYDRLPKQSDQSETETTVPEHSNVRGSQYYKQDGGASVN